MTKKEITESCIDCPKHEIINDRDPHDWFCDNDAAIICTLVKNDRRDITSKYLSNHSEFKSITTACRPYNLRKETKIPEWCPKRKNNNENKFK